MLRPSLALLACVAFAMLGGAACAANTDAADDDAVSANQGEDALVGGRAAAPGQFPSTVYLKSGCSATKVGPKLLLTAAHCVVDPATVSIRFPAGSVVSVATDPAKGFTDVAIAEVHVHPSWMKACDASYCASSAVNAQLDGADVSVIELATELAGVPSAVVSSEALQVGDRVTVTGFGCTAGVLVPDAREQVTLKYASTRTVPAERAVHDGSSVTSSMVPQVDGIYALTSGPGAAKAKAGLCPGDSGGALYVRLGDTLAVAGVNSNYTMAPQASDQVGLPITNWHTRLDEASRHGVAAWLRSVGVPTTPSAPASAK